MADNETVDRLTTRLRDEDFADARLIWDYHQLGHEMRRVSVGIGLGSHDVGVATFAAGLYQRGLYPRLVFTGANSQTTAKRFPRGEAVHYRAHAIELGVPADAILVEPRATNTGQNIAYTRDLLSDAIESVMLISKPYMERRAYATCRKVWPEVDVVCASEPIDFSAYLSEIGSPALVVDMLVGDLQRVIEYPALGFAVEQGVPDDVLAAYHRLVNAGFTSRLMATSDN
ncbi:YdcF family protein [Kribbella sp.]|uniref:YdcF family protein n=1 Tax=Kribbella sp. TaxID=1871183 RepID=UPI002D57EEFA|nr:YdcF family protein [Kribbella sp.]HZX04921.1 YdcF family protein [Kribbella sp.]